jgi:hypothetical protein
LLDTPITSAPIAFSGDGSSVIDPGYVLILIGLFVFGLWMSKAQDEYMRAYAAATGSTPVTTPDIYRMMFMRPWRLVTSAPLTQVSRALGAKQTDPALETLRRRAITRRWITILVGFGTFFGYFLLRSGRV